MKEIFVCCKCKAPVVFTMAFAYKEYLCLNCGRATEFLGGADRVKGTPELRAASKVINDVWRAVYKSFTPRSRYKKRNCKKCVGSEDHNEHRTKQEVLRDEVATKVLKKIRGAF